MDWLGKHDIQARGHGLVWLSWRYLPKDVASLNGDPAAPRKRVADVVPCSVAGTDSRAVAVLGRDAIHATVRVRLPDGRPTATTP